MTGLRRGWCPTVHAPMATGDGLLARVKPSCGVLTAATARALAAASLRWGNGALGLTGRGNIQVRGLSPESVAPFAAAMVAAGLADADPSVERRRNVLVSPLAGDDPSVAPGTAALGRAIEAMLADAAFAALPDKFGISVNGGGFLSIGGIGADVRVIAADVAGEWWVVSPDAVVQCAERDAVDVCRRMMLARTPPPTPSHKGRGDTVSSSSPLPLWAWAAKRTKAGGGERTAQKPVGFLPYQATASGAFGLAPPFGLLRAEALASLADMAERHGDGTLRLTPWRVVMLAGATPRAAADGVAAGMIVDPADRRLRISACPGRPACAQATVATIADATRLAAHHANDGDIHISGCAKGCAHPGPAALTFVGRDGAYDMIRNGRACDPPLCVGVTDIVAACAA